MSSEDVKTMAAAGYIAGCLAAQAKDDGGVLPAMDLDGNYTGEVRFLFLGDWYSVPCPTPWQVPTSKPQGGPWTRHGHYIPGVTVEPAADVARPPVARCGGPAICPQCSQDAAQATDPA